MSPRTNWRSLLAVLILMSLPAVIRPALGLEHDRSIGEPYALAGRRLMFTSWIHVRPGQYDWQNREGRSVFASGDKAGPFDAAFRRIDIPSGIRLCAEPARRVGPIIAGDRPWDAMGVSAGSLLQDEGRYRFWGGSQDAAGKRYGCYLESPDGRTWTKPSLGTVPFEGSRENNLVSLTFAPAPFKDPSATPGERYKTVWHGDYDPRRFEEFRKTRPWSKMALQTDPGRVHSIRAAVSPDGLRWTELPDAVSVEPSDTQVVGYHDAQLGKYVLYTRSYMIGPEAPGLPGSESRRSAFLPRRAIGRTESHNFREFPPSEVIIEPGNDLAPADSYYTNCRTAVPGAPDHHLMFPALYHQATDVTSISLFSSYDGKTWSRVPGSPVLTTATFGEWDGGCVFASPELVELADGTWALPYTGYVYPHKYPRGAWKYAVGLATWPKGRLVGIVADERGEFTTAAVIAPGRTLHVNALTLRAGSILVEAADLDGNPLPGRSFADAEPVVGDQFWTAVRWKDHPDIGVDVGKPVEFRFRLDHARLYGLEFR